MNVSLCVYLLLYRNRFIFLNFFFDTSVLFYGLLFLLFLLTHLIALSCLASLYNHFFIYLSHIHSDEGLQSKKSVRKFFSHRCNISEQTQNEIKEEKTIFKSSAGIEPHIFGLLVRRVNHYTDYTTRT